MTQEHGTAPSGSPTSDATRADARSPHLETPMALRALQTSEARTARTGFRVGQTVTTNCPRSPRFHKRTGVVVGTSLGEVGVTFNGHARADAWFLPSELTKEAR